MTLTVRDASRLLRVSEKTVYRWIGRRTIPAYVMNGQYRFNRAELLEWATSRQIGVSVELLAEPESRDTPCPDLAAALESGGIFYRVEGHERETALRNVVSLMRLPAELDRDFVLRALLARESLASTGVGDGIAIPHVRNPVVPHVLCPSVTLCFLERAIEFAALDGRPVSILFTVISPTLRAHLYLMARLGFALRDPEFKRTVLCQSSREAVLQAARCVEESFRQPAAQQPAARDG
ncbi:MAG: helix-turn-helix domain-containing protein [Phycisphaerales bacterium]|nr:MAG: helix-turn-helix domain-containing protein [Phycisphaerales bacterium]